MRHRGKFSGALAVTLSLLMLLVSAFAMTSCDDDDDNNNTNNTPYTISGNAGGSQVVPAVMGNGTGTISGTYDPATRQLTYTSNWGNLTGAPTSGGFYSGATGTSGTAVGTPWSIPANAMGTGSTSGTMTLTEAQAQSFLNGGWYYSYGTTDYPGGEVRGQISAAR